MIVIDQEMLGTKFINTLFNTVGNLATEKGLDKDLIMKELWATDTQENMVDIIYEHFGDEIIIKQYVL